MADISRMGFRVFSLWRCPTCLKLEGPAFSLHAPEAVNVRCPYCRREMSARAIKRSRGVFIRKIALVRDEDPRGSNARALIGRLNAEAMNGRRPDIEALLSDSRLEFLLLTRPDLL